MIHPQSGNRISLFKKILIANRGEIALRIIRAARELGIKTVAVYSEADRDSLHVKFADEAVCIGPPSSKQSYLNIPRLIAAAEVTNADAIHPGYGFLAENANFAEICNSSGITFIGPSPDAITSMGDKALAKETMKKAGVPIVPGSDGTVADVPDAKKVAQEIVENARTAPTNNVQIASNLGVPYNPVLPESVGLTPKEAATQFTSNAAAARAYIEKEIAPSVNTVDKDIDNLEQAKALLGKIRTGSLAMQVPVLGTLVKAKTNKAGFEQFDRLASAAAAQNKIPGNTSVSNADLQFMQRGVFGSEKENSSNAIIINYMLAQRKRDRDYYRFMTNYAAVNGTTGAPAISAWREYVDNNPLTTQDNNGSIALNPSVITPEQYFSMPRRRFDAAGKPIQ